MSQKRAFYRVHNKVIYMSFKRSFANENDDKELQPHSPKKLAQVIWLKRKR
ncbi:MULTISPECIES: hypothetical protein [unclassified Pseudoalteromonas]|uniref:hypothetical protein n=1 Tax=unclassified Pseudoalteromonas TaxID=194690 RepID=UPI00131A3D71|nr:MULTISPECIES: hypothetical protein [unclassified Pseudoalteromonas]MBS3796259.1 hypothetical protein [Pseudoalteromonas sp. BDTF-M6]